MVDYLYSLFSVYHHFYVKKLVRDFSTVWLNLCYLVKNLEHNKY